MNEQAHQYVEDFMAQLILRNPNEPEFHQAVREVAESLAPHIVASPVLQKMKVLERIAEPERVIIFRVPWLNDKGEIEINRGYRVQMNSAIGPYKGGLRFHPSVNLGVLKFLAFEQVFKNSLTSTCRPVISVSAAARSATCSASTSACPTNSPRC